MNNEPSKKLVRVRPEKEHITKRQLNYFLGISDQSAGAQGISMNLVNVPPGGRADPHIHVDFESTIYILQGKVDNRFGEGLKESIITEAGDFIYIPPGVPHQPVNMSDTEPAVAVVARTTASQQENVMPYSIDQ